MKKLSQKETIRKINSLSAKQIPFIFIINFDGTQAYVEPLSEIDAEELLYNFNGVSNEPTQGDYENSPYSWKSHPISFESYQQSFNIVRDNILKGNTFLINLTAQTPITTNLDLRDIFYRSKAMYKLWVKDQFVVFSPEIFIKINQQTISSYPMKGTISCQCSEPEKSLMENEKEMAEHATIVDLIRNDLSKIANHVTVKRYRYIDKLATNNGDILQTSSEIVGHLDEDFHLNLGEKLFELLPAGSITGAPKHKTIDIIHQAESYKRNFYTGVMGISDGKSLDSAVMIRFIEQENKKLFFKSGGGITFRSDAHDEYEELIQKVYVPIC